MQNEAICPENRGKCSAGHTHIQPKDEKRIKGQY